MVTTAQRQSRAADKTLFGLSGRGCLPCFITFVYVSVVDLTLVRHFFLLDEEGVLRQPTLDGQPVREWASRRTEGKKTTPSGQMVVLQARAVNNNEPMEFKNILK